jgi:hypothetical protein
MKTTLALASFALLATSSVAQEIQGLRWYGTLGAYNAQPTTTGVSITNSTSSGVGYRLRMMENHEVTIEVGSGLYTLRGQSETVDLSVGGLTLNYLAKREKSFYGLGIGFSSGEAKRRVGSSTFRSEESGSFFLQIQAGQNLTERTFLRARFQTAPSESDKLYTGFAIEFGYRF